MDKIKTILIATCSTLSSLLGTLFIPVILMVTCNVIDYITGLLASGCRGEQVTSSKGLKGIIKKICMWLLVVVGVIIDELLTYAMATTGLPNPFTFLVACVVCIWIICNELISILENIADIGVPLPGFLNRIVNYIKDHTENTINIPDNETDGKGDVV